MRPNGYSAQGFLGHQERLDTLVAQDAQRLAALDLTSTQIADKIQQLLEKALTRKYGVDWPDFPTRDEESEAFYAVWQPAVGLPKSWLCGEKGYAVDQFQILIMQYRGYQDCPWDCSVDPSFASFDFVIINRTTGHYFTGPALITHLIRDHGFFEGVHSFYRVDPLRAARVLALI